MSIRFRNFLKASSKRVAVRIEDKKIESYPVTLCQLYPYFLEPIAEEIFEFFELCDDPLEAAIDSIEIYPNKIRIRAIILAIYFIINKIDIDDFDDPKEFIEICSREIKKMSRDLRYILKL